jgi:hypothetical protein
LFIAKTRNKKGLATLGGGIGSKQAVSKVFSWQA